MHGTPNQSRLTKKAPGGPISRRSIWITLFLSILIILWDMSGLDIPVSGYLGAQAFPLRHNVWAESLLHNAMQKLSWGVLLGLWGWAAYNVSGHARSDEVHDAPQKSRLVACLSISLCAILVPGIKRISHTSCPWDMALFHGTFPYVSHWQWLVQDGGPGHCFPAGHAVTGFAFLGMYFVYRYTRPRLAQLWLCGSITAGCVLGTVQIVRGAHYVSHVMWAGFFCWLLSLAVHQIFASSTRDNFTRFIQP
jgi:membrane-associated PAP2 superfamily phosphatase